jgi:hypothetical protein
MKQQIKKHKKYINKKPKEFKIDFRNFRNYFKISQIEDILSHS